MSVSVLEWAAGLRGALAGFDPALLSGDDCARVADELATTEKACGAARLLAAARAVDCGAHQPRGFQNGVAWLARQSGATTSSARQALETASRLGGCPDTKTALLAGEVSVSQAAEIAQAEAETPGAEAALLEHACGSDLSALREQARTYRQAHTDVEDLHRQQQQARHFRHWRDRLGMVCFTAALPPEAGLPLVRRVELAAHRARRAAREAGTGPERFEAYAADALAAATASSGQPTRRRDGVEVVIVCDLYAWRRGHTHRGEVCHIIDGGPIPVHVAKQLGHDAFLKAALHDGVKIDTVTHFGRHRPAELQTALDLGPVPAFTGAECADCGQRWCLQWDHVNPVANGGPTTYTNLQPRCWADHRAKTERDRQAGLLGPQPP